MFIANTMVVTTENVVIAFLAGVTFVSCDKLECAVPRSDASPWRGGKHAICAAVSLPVYAGVVGANEGDRTGRSTNV